MKNTSKDTSIVRDTADQRKAKKQGTIAGTLENVKLFFVGDGGKSIDLDLTPELKALMLIY